IPGAWVEIGPGNDTGLHGDDLTISFAATHGNSIAPAGNLFICTNGMVCTTAFANFSNGPLGVGTPAIGYFPFWDDMWNVLPSPGIIRAANLADRTVIQWNDMQFFPGGGPTGSFQLQIFDTGAGPGGALAQFVYDSSISGLNSGAGATIGAV